MDNIDAGTINQLTSAFSSAYGVAKDLLSIEDPKERQQAVMKLNETIAEAQARSMAAYSLNLELHDKIRALEQENDNLRKKQNKIGSYKLFTLFEGQQVYRYQGDEEEAHDVCPRCFADEVIGVISSTTDKKGGKRYSCKKCNWIVDDPVYRKNMDYLVRGFNSGF